MTRGKSALKKRKFTVLEQFYIHFAHPICFVMAIIGWMWGVYFLWAHNVTLAVAFAFGFTVIGQIAVWGHREDAVAETTLGKLTLLHAHPMSMLFHIVGGIVLVLGLYAHVTELILWGVSLLLFAHMWGWSQVHLLGE